jgi:hypothetical protein
MAPNIAPGKKPTAMAPAGYSGQDAEMLELELADFSADGDGDGTGVIVA